MYRLLPIWESFEVIAEQVWILYFHATAISINMSFDTQYSGMQDLKSLVLNLLYHLVFSKVFSETHELNGGVFFPPSFSLHSCYWNPTMKERNDGREQS